MGLGRGPTSFYHFSRDCLAYHPHVVPATAVRLPDRAAVARKTRLTAFWCRRRRAAVSTYEKPMEKSVCMIMKINTDNKKKKS
jgi:hypothetical protein